MCLKRGARFVFVACRKFYLLFEISISAVIDSPPLSLSFSFKKDISFLIGLKNWLFLPFGPLWPLCRCGHSLCSHQEFNNKKGMFCFV